VRRRANLVTDRSSYPVASRRIPSHPVVSLSSFGFRIPNDGFPVKNPAENKSILDSFVR